MSRHRYTNAELLLQRLASQWGQDLDEMLGAASVDDLVPGICVGCAGYSTKVEPDQRLGYCERCGGKSVTSCLVLARLI